MEKAQKENNLVSLVFLDCICLGSTSPLRYALLPSPSLWIVLLHSMHRLCPANKLFWPSSCPSSQARANTHTHTLSIASHLVDTASLGFQSWLLLLTSQSTEVRAPIQKVSQSQPWGHRESNLHSHVIDECSTSASTQLASRWRQRVRSSYKQRP